MPWLVRSRSSQTSSVPDIFWLCSRQQLPAGTFAPVSRGRNLRGGYPSCAADTKGSRGWSRISGSTRGGNIRDFQFFTSPVRTKRGWCRMHASPGLLSCLVPLHSSCSHSVLDPGPAVIVVIPRLLLHCTCFIASVCAGASFFAFFCFCHES